MQVDKNTEEKRELKIKREVRKRNLKNERETVDRSTNRQKDNEKERMKCKMHSALKRRVSALLVYKHIYGYIQLYI